MVKLRVTVTHPTTRTDGSAFDPATDLKQWRVRRNIPGGYSPSDYFPYTQTQYDIPGLTVGQELTLIIDWFDQFDQLQVKVLSPVVQAPPPPPVPAPPSVGNAVVTYLAD